MAINLPQEYLYCFGCCYSFSNLQFNHLKLLSSYFYLLFYLVEEIILLHFITILFKKMDLIRFSMNSE